MTDSPPAQPLFVGLLDSPREDEKLEMFLTEREGGEVSVTLRAIARSGMGWYPQKTISIHRDQLQALGILVKRARGLLAQRRTAEEGKPDDPQVIRLPRFDPPAGPDQDRSAGKESGRPPAPARPASHHPRRHP